MESHPLIIEFKIESKSSGSEPFMKHTFNIKPTLISMALVLSNLNAAHAATLETGIENASDYKNSVLSSSMKGGTYYKIGGARPYQPSITGTTTSIKIGGTAKAGLGYSCGQFDPKLSIDALFDNVKNQVEEGMNSLVQGATSAVASLPAYLIQRNNPGIYELMQSNLFRAEQKFDVSTKSCEQLEADIRSGKDPYAEWTSMAKGEAWQEKAESGEEVSTAKEDIDRDGGSITWVGGVKSGGPGEPVIKPTADVSKAGYNILLGRSPTTTNAAPEGSVMARYFETPEDMASWTSSVVGDAEIQTFEAGSSRKTQAPLGLKPDIEKNYPEIYAAVLKVVENYDDLDSLSDEDRMKAEAPGIEITKELVDAINTAAVADVRIKSEYIALVAQDVAVAQSVDKALVARRALLAGLHEPNVKKNDVAQKDIKEKIASLDAEIEHLEMEKRVRNQFVSLSAQTIIEQEKQNNTDIGNTSINVNSDLGGL